MQQNPLVFLYEKEMAGHPLLTCFCQLHATSILWEKHRSALVDKREADMIKNVLIVCTLTFNRLS